MGLSPAIASIGPPLRNLYLGCLFINRRLTRIHYIMVSEFIAILALYNYLMFGFLTLQIFAFSLIFDGKNQS